MESIRSDYNMLLILTVLTIIGAILLYVFILPDSKYNSLHPALRFVHDFLKVKKLWLESILRFFFVCDCVLCVLFGICVVIKSFWGGLLVIILGPIILRLIFEFFMMFVLAVRNIIEINNKISGTEGKSAPKSELFEQPPFASAVAQTVAERVLPVQRKSTPAQNASTMGLPICPQCGSKIDRGSTFCTTCGNRLS